MVYLSKLRKRKKNKNSTKQENVTLYDPYFLIEHKKVKNNLPLLIVPYLPPNKSSMSS